MNKKRPIIKTIGLSCLLSLSVSITSHAAPYTVAKGDNLWKIARDKLGDGKRYVEIFEANKDQISDPDKIRTGQVIEIPDGSSAPETKQDLASDSEVLKDGDVVNDFNGDDVEAIKDRWKKLSTLPDYAPNNEITGEYDKALAAKCVNGTFVGQLEDEVKVWRGIPYAKQPVGNLRFKAPQAADPSDGVYEAFHFMKSGMQPIEPGEKASKYVQGEECLGLNVWSSKENESSKPVFVFIHGGGWMAGGTADPIYNGYYFAKYNPDILVVTIDYRLGMLGQIVLSDFLDGKDYPGSEALCMLDVIESLKWIQNNIAAFGGDPGNVTICGESAGGGAVSMLCVMPEAKGLFGKAIPMSGTVTQFNGLEKAAGKANALMEEFGAKTVSDLQKIPFEELRQWWGINAVRINHYPIRGGGLIEADPLKAWARGDSSDINILQGNTADEYRYFHSVFEGLDEMFDAVCEGTALNILDESGSEYAKDYQDYIKILEKLGNTGNRTYWKFMDDMIFNAGIAYQAQMHAKNGGKGYVYTFEKAYDGDLAYLGAAHAVDCFYLFGTFNGVAAFGTPDEEELSKKFQRMIANFCKTGDPSVDGLSWPEYNTKSRYRMMIGDNMRVEENPEGERVDVTLRMVDHSDGYRYMGNVGTWVEGARRINPDIVDKFMRKAESMQK